MKIIIAPDSFKGNLTSLQAALAIEKGIKRVLPRSKCIKVPMADGGEGTVQSLVDATGGKFLYKKVIGPDGYKVRARYGLLADNKTAVIEMAEASGLPLVSGTGRNPLTTTTYGTGELIIAAIANGADKIIIGIGGSATIDGGMGMAQALGVRFMDMHGKTIKQYGSGGLLNKIRHIDITAIDAGIRKTKITIAGDVDNPLCGGHGAAHVFGPQKGATPAMVKQLDSALGYFAGIIKKELGKDVRMIKGGGAAGGLGAGLVAFANAGMKSGIDIVTRITALKKHIEGADLVITGEGRIDFQTAFGKTPAGVARVAGRCKVPVIAIGGSLADDARNIFAYGIDGLESAIARDLPLEEALACSREFLANAAERAVRLILVGNKIARRKQVKMKRG